MVSPLPSPRIQNAESVTHRVLRVPVELAADATSVVVTVNRVGHRNRAGPGATDVTAKIRAGYIRGCGKE